MYITIPYFMVGGNGSDHRASAKFSTPDLALLASCTLRNIVLWETGAPAPQQIKAMVMSDSFDVPVMAALPCPKYCEEDGTNQNARFTDASTSPEIQALAGP